MSKPNKVPLISTGLSRNSSRSYQTNILRSTAELNKTLRNLDRELNTNISKILNDRHELRNSEEVKRSESFPRRTRPEKYHYHGFSGIVDDGLSVANDLSVDYELEESDFSFSSKDEIETWQGPSLKHKPSKDGHDKQICHLPSIIEETTRKTRQKLISAKSERTPLPPLPESMVCQHVAAVDNLNEVGSIPHRRVSESHADIGFSQRVSLESKDVARNLGKSRQRSSTLPVGYPHALLDRSLTKRVSKPLTVDSDVPSVDPRSDIDREHKHLHRSNSDSQSKTAWDEDMMKCRYIRRIRSCSSPDVLDVDAIFGPYKV